jgi:hypothetical protein
MFLRYYSPHQSIIIAKKYIHAGMFAGHMVSASKIHKFGITGGEGTYICKPLFSPPAWVNGLEN